MFKETNVENSSCVTEVVGKLDKIHEAEISSQKALVKKDKVLQRNEYIYKWKGLEHMCTIPQASGT